MSVVEKYDVIVCGGGLSGEYLNNGASSLEYIYL